MLEFSTTELKLSMDVHVAMESGDPESHCRC